MDMDDATKQAGETYDEAVEAAKGLSTGAMLGIGIGAFFGLCLVGTLIWWCVKGKKNDDDEPELSAGQKRARSDKSTEPGGRFA